jgi:hypothetical protein
MTPMKSGMKIHSFPTVGLILLVVVTGCINWKPNPSDAELERRYQENTVDFDRFASLCRDNPQIYRMGMNDAYIKEAGAEKRVRSESPYVFLDQPYQEMGGLLQNLGLRGGLARCPEAPEYIFFYADCRGMHPNASCKGYVYSTKALQPTLDSLDADPPATLDQHKRAYKRLSEHWYILYEVWPGTGNRCLTTG